MVEPSASSQDFAHLPPSLAGKRFCVTGAAGFIGSHLTEALLGCGAEVVGLDDLSTGEQSGSYAGRSADGSGVSTSIWTGTTSTGLAASPVAGPPETVTRITDDGFVHVTEDGGLIWNVPAGPLANIVEGKRVLSDPAQLLL